jgi:hypothetical protein
VSGVECKIPGGVRAALLVVELARIGGCCGLMVVDVL